MTALERIAEIELDPLTPDIRWLLAYCERLKTVADAAREVQCLVYCETASQQKKRARLSEALNKLAELEKSE